MVFHSAATDSLLHLHTLTLSMLCFVFLMFDCFFKYFRRVDEFEQEDTETHKEEKNNKTEQNTNRVF